MLLQNRVNFLTTVAGDSTQVIKTKEYLVKLGVMAEIDSSSETDLTGYDLVHLFNIIPVEETYRLFQNAVKQNKRIVLSTIYWDPSEFLKESQQLESFGKWWGLSMTLREEILKQVNLILPNSQMELTVLRQSFLELPPAIVVPNAADSFFVKAKPDRFIRRYQWQNFLLAVGRISRRKNQLNLIRAAKELDIPLVLIGPLNDSDYYLECRREAAGHRVLFIDALPPVELASAYAAAKVHALVSWYDTPGLVSLEAALTGCNIVSTDRGSAPEYFGDLADYCDPGNIDSIKQAIHKAWLKKRNTQLKEHVLQNFTWEKAALATQYAYQTLINHSDGKKREL